MTAALEVMPPVLRVPAVYIQVHPEYNLDGRKLNDIAIIKLAWEVELNDYVQLACLPDPSDVGYPTQYGVDAFAMGWGVLEYDKQALPDNLQNVVLQLLDGHTQCYSDQQQLFDWHLQVCAAILEGGKDTCQGRKFIF